MMNKYQEYLLKNFLGQNFIFDLCCPQNDEHKGNKIQYGNFNKEADTYTITQDEDINIVEYVLLIATKRLSKFLDKVYIEAKNGWEEVNVSNYGERQIPVYRVVINFNDKINSLKLCFANGLADDYILHIEYVEADKSVYYAKQEEKKKADLLAAANIKHSTGNDLVNIYFQPCCTEYVRTEIELYKDGTLLAKYKVDDDVFFKSISGLAFGEYEYVVKQFGNNMLLLNTDKIKFSIRRPNYSGRQTVSW